MVGAFLKILHPTDGPGDREFEEYVEYAVECRRRVKKQMNKRKPDDEFARVNLSYIKADGQEQIVFCPESKRASATREPLRRRLRKAEEETRPAQETKPEPEPKEPEKASSDQATQATQAKSTAPEVEEKHFTIRR